jgi:penicillin-binding protein 1A
MVGMRFDCNNGKLAAQSGRVAHVSIAGRHVHREPGDYGGLNVRLHRGCRIGLGIFAFSVAAICLWLYFWLFYDLPSPDGFGVYIAESNSESNYQPVPLSEIPETMRRAVVALEDIDFYVHPTDIDPIAVLRAIWVDLQRDKYIVCGTSITQKLVADLMSASGKHVENPRRQRMREMALTILITQRYAKDEILEFYLNSMYYGNGVYGVEAAAQFYYGKRIRDLDLAECAMLESISWFSGLNSLEDQERIKEFQTDVLALMVEARYISREEAILAQKAPIVFVNQ